MTESKIEPNTTEQRDAVIVAVNPAAGAGEKTMLLEQLVPLLQQRGFATEVESDINVILERARQGWQAGRLRTVLAVGGDGTASLMAHTLPSEIPLTLLPSGTENLLAKHLELSPEVEDVVEVIAAGGCVEIDAGMANDRLFLIMASCGFDADVVTQVHRQRRGNIHHLSYALPIWRAIRTYRYPLLRLYVDDNPQPVKAKWAFVFNVPRYAMGLPIVENADETDGRFDVCTFRRGYLASGLLYLIGVIFRMHSRFRDTNMFQASKLRIESDGVVPYQLDGDPGGQLPLEIMCLPRRLRLLVSRQWAERRKVKFTPLQPPMAMEIKPAS